MSVNASSLNRVTKTPGFIVFLLGLGLLAPSKSDVAAAAGMEAAQPLILAQARRQPPPRSAPPAAAAPAPADSLEARFWGAIKDSKDASDYQTYLDAYPDGQYAAQARARLQELGKPTTPTAGGGLTIQPVNPTPPTTPSTPPPTDVRSASATRDCDQCPGLALIPAGAFPMGSTDFFPFEGPVHQVTIRKSFYLATRETTYDEWDACVAEGGCSYTPNDRGQGRGARPVANVDWNDAHQFTAWLSKKTGKTYRLPSEAEWEYAARGGVATAYYWGRAMDKGKANCSGCDAPHSAQTVATGSFPPNPYGLYDMAGNAAEWVEDCWNDSYRGAPVDGSAWTKPQCQERVLRGGSFNNDPRYLRSASRFKYDFDVRYYTNGFRVLREAP